MFKALDISTSGLVAQRQRMNTISGNIANVNTTVDSDGKASPYQRRYVTFMAEKEQAKSGNGAKVQYRVEVDNSADPRLVHQPGHPQANEDGYVAYPNINVIQEYVNAMEANRAYEANISAIEMSKEMSNLGLRILG
jgi:flagellar basal-body rod protein FlgC